MSLTGGAEFHFPPKYVALLLEYFLPFAESPSLATKIEYVFCVFVNPRKKSLNFIILWDIAGMKELLFFTYNFQYSELIRVIVSPRRYNSATSEEPQFLFLGSHCIKKLREIRFIMSVSTCTKNYNG